MTFIKPLEYGGHALVWSGDWSPKGARKAISGAARAGYDYIEIALLDPWKVDAALTKDLLQEFNLRAHASLGLSPGTDVTSTHAAIVAKGDELLRKATDVLFDMGGKELCGVIYCALGKYPGPASKENRANSVAAMQRLADHAADKGININLDQERLGLGSVHNALGHGRTLRWRMGDRPIFGGIPPSAALSLIPFRLPEIRYQTISHMPTVVVIPRQVFQQKPFLIQESDYHDGTEQDAERECPKRAKGKRCRQKPKDARDV